jgi:uncharacterized protein YecE (DUF72 family)
MDAARRRAYPVRIGTAGWNIPRAVVERLSAPRGPFSDEGTHLERYARVLSAAEINSSFYRPHRPSTYARWASSVPRSFRFSVKMPKTITHERRLVGAETCFASFIEQVAHLGTKLGPLLSQLPPSLAYDASVARSFFEMVRGRYAGAIVFEPRHASWFTAESDSMLQELAITRVTADPPTPGVGPQGSSAYLRLHGVPRVYYSSYDAAALDALSARLRHARETAETWCIFDNTALGAAMENALSLRELLGD